MQTWMWAWTQIQAQVCSQLPVQAQMQMQTQVQAQAQMQVPWLVINSTHAGTRSRPAWLLCRLLRLLQAPFKQWLLGPLQGLNIRSSQRAISSCSGVQVQVQVQVWVQGWGWARIRLRVQGRMAMLKTSRVMRSGCSRRP